MHWSPEMLCLYWVQPYDPDPDYYAKLYETTPQSTSHLIRTQPAKREGLLKCYCDMILSFIKLMFPGMKT